MTYTAFIYDPNSNKKRGEQLKDRFQAVLDREYYGAPDIETIKEQDGIGLDTYHDINVRINRGIRVYTGREVGNDWRLLMFKDVDHPVILGLKYFFDNNWWLVYNIETANNLAASCMVKRCNNVLRWKDINGNLYSEPCIFDSLVARARDQISAEDLVNVQGYINCYVQLNDKTALIEENQRFLIGHPKKRIAYKVFGNGIRNFINNYTYDDSSASLLMLTLGGSHVNPATDDLENGIANAYPYHFEIGDLPVNIIGKPNTSYQLQPILYQDGVALSDGEFIYETLDSSVAIVDSTGNVSLIADGITQIKVSYFYNSDVYDVVDVVVDSNSVDQTITITPEPSFILEGEEVVYTARLFVGGEEIPNTIFTINVSDQNEIPSANFEITQLSDNMFKVKNIKRYLYKTLKLEVSANTYSREIEIELRGLF